MGFELISLSIIGKACAFLTAVTWAMALVLFKKSTESLSPIALNLFKNVVGLVLLIATLAFAPLFWTSESISAVMAHPLTDHAILIVSGVIGIALADTLFLHALDLVGVGILSIVDCLYSPFVILFSLLILPEYLSLSLVVGASLILVGVFASSRHTPPPNRTKGQLIAGILLGALAMALMAIGIVAAKLVLEGGDYPLVWATTMRLGAGSIALAIYMAGSPHRSALWKSFRPSASWRVSVPASVLGTYVAMLFWVAGFKYAPASVVSVLNQMSVIFATLFAALILKEALTLRKVIALTLAFTGALIVSLGPSLEAWGMGGG